MKFSLLCGAAMTLPGMAFAAGALPSPIVTNISLQGYLEGDNTFGTALNRITFAATGPTVSCLGTATACRLTISNPGTGFQGFGFSNSNSGTVVSLGFLQSNAGGSLSWTGAGPIVANVQLSSASNAMLRADAQGNELATTLASGCALSAGGTLTCPGTYTLPAASAGALGGVFSQAAASHQFLTALSTAGSLSAGQPDFTDLTGSATLAQLPLAASGTWTPSVSAVTPGDLALSGVTASGTYDRSILAFGCDVRVSFSWTGVVTYTTASGNFMMTGLPYTRLNDNQVDELSPAGALSTFTWPNSATQIMWEVASNKTSMLLRGFKSAANPGVLTITGIPSGTTLTIGGSGVYRATGC